MGTRRRRLDRAASPEPRPAQKNSSQLLRRSAIGKTQAIVEGQFIVFSLMGPEWSSSIMLRTFRRDGGSQRAPQTLADGSA